MVKIKVDYIAKYKLHTMIIDFPLDDKVALFCAKLSRRKDVANVEVLEVTNDVQTDNSL